MKLLRLIFTFSALIVLLCGCTAAYTGKIFNEQLEILSLRDKVMVSRQNNWVIPAHSRVSIANFEVSTRKEEAFNAIIAVDDKKQVLNYHKHFYPRAQTSLTRKLLMEVSKRVQTVKLASSYNNGNYLYVSRLQASQFLIKPTVLQLKDALNTRQEINYRGVSDGQRVGKDTVSFLFSVVDVNTGILLDSATVTVNSQLFASSDSNVEVLINKGVEAYVASITAS